MSRRALVVTAEHVSQADKWRPPASRKVSMELWPIVMEDGNGAILAICPRSGSHEPLFLSTTRARPARLVPNGGSAVSGRFWPIAVVTTTLAGWVVSAVVALGVRVFVR